MICYELDPGLANGHRFLIVDHILILKCIKNVNIRMLELLYICLMDFRYVLSFFFLHKLDLRFETNIALTFYYEEAL